MTTTYTPTVWVDSVPEETPIKYNIRDEDGVLVNENVSVETATLITPGTPVNAVNMNKLEQGVQSAQDTANDALDAAENAQTTADVATFLYSMRDIPVVLTLNKGSALAITDKAVTRVPLKLNGGLIIGVVAFCDTPSTSGVVTIDVKKNNVSIFTVLVSIDANEKDSTTATTAAVLNSSQTTIAVGDILKAEVSAAGSGVLYCGVEITIRPTGG